ncbi:MAG: NAD(P)-binding domain-containing protein [Myxococcales bacterium]|nr:NAD(P)-binding domain-containing protein [Myxococcales bacterium]
MSALPDAMIYFAVLAAIWAFYAWRRNQQSKASRATLQANQEAGLTEPMSLHPVVDPNLCIGSGSCVSACPEKNVLGMLDGKAELISPADCIGHGACAKECPVDAITLVLGTERRGIDVPALDPDFQTNVPGIFVAGELGGMGLIRNAIEQGRQAMDSIRAHVATNQGCDLDVVIVGAGPAGFSASLAAMKHGLRCATLDQETLGGTVAHYPRGKIVMTAPAELPMVGKVKIRETTKEALIEFWQSVEKKTQVKINYGERVDSIQSLAQGFEVKSTKTTYQTNAVLLAIGRRGTPRKLGVPGEDQTKVVYRLTDPDQYRGQAVLVVGGGDSALEAATVISDVVGSEVTLSYRSAAFSRAKQKNREKVDEAANFRGLRVMMESKVLEVRPSAVILETADGVEEIANDAVIVCAGGVLPNGFLESIGVELRTARGEPL